MLCCHLWSVRLYHIFPHYLANGTIFGKKSYWIQNVFWFYLQFSCETFLILRSFGRDIIINVRRSSCNIPRSSCHTLMKLEFSPQSFENYWNIKFHENSSIGSRIVSRVRRDGQTNKDDEFEWSHPVVYWFYIYLFNLPYSFRQHNLQVWIYCYMFRLTYVIIQACLWTLNIYNLLLRIWDPRRLTVFVRIHCNCNLLFLCVLGVCVCVSVCSFKTTTPNSSTHTHTHTRRTHRNSKL